MRRYNGILSHQDEGYVMGMPSTIDGHAAIQSSLARGWELDSYAQIQWASRETDVSSDTGFQWLHNRFYRVRRNVEWQAVYYEIMQLEKTSTALSFKDVLREMRERTSNVEASFMSKIIAILDPDRPIWDSIVLERLGLKLKGTTAMAKLENAVGVYESIVGWYANYLATEDAARNIALLDELLPDYA